MDFDKTFSRNFKAQFWSFDVVFALVIFGIALTVLTFTWYNLNNQLALAYGGGDTILQLQTKSLASDILSTGVPANWQSVVNTMNTLTWTNVSVGLASAPLSSNISTSKLYAMASMSNYNYQASKQLLGMAFDYYIAITSNPTSGAGLNITMGRNPLTNNALTTYVERRSAFVNGIPVSVRIMAWTNTTLATS
jgi:hypothetical protein